MRKNRHSTSACSSLVRTGLDDDPWQMTGRCLALSVLLVFGCSDGPGDMDAGDDSDAGGMDAGEMDAGADDAGADDAGGPTDAGASDAGGGCPMGQHMCPGGCVDDNPNDPAMGCRLGCGDPCMAPTGGTAACGTDGMCVGECTPPGILEGDRCCGGALECSAGVNFLLACPMPSEEPNDDNLTARLVGTYDDEAASAEGIGNLALPMGDVDFFRFNVTDSCCSLNTRVEVGVEASVADAVELAAWVTCDAGTDSHTCDGTSDTTNGFGCRTIATGSPLATGRLEFNLDCSGTTDEGASVLVRVQPTASATMCLDYELTWRAYN